MNKKELVKELKALQNDDDNETSHSNADSLLLEYIDDKEVKEAFNKIEKWYA